jgi:hypothetical protein
MKGRNSLSGPLPDPAGDAGHDPQHPPRVQRLFDIRLQEAEVDRPLIGQAVGNERGNDRDAG